MFPPFLAISDISANIIITYDYDAYGNVSLTSGSQAFQNDRLFTGREYEKETGLYYYRARFYSPKTGRFLSRDPIGIQDDVNLYAYVGNNPVMFTDPSGKIKQAIEDTAELLDDADFDRKVVGATLIVGGQYVGATMGPICAQASAATATCVGLLAVTGPGGISCAAPALVAGASCGATVISGGAVLGGAYLMSSSSPSSSSSSGGGGGKTLNQIKKDIENGKAPKGIERLDKDVIKDGKNIDPTHIHLTDGTAIYKNGTIKHTPSNGKVNLSNKQIEWLKSIGWEIK